MISGLEKNSVGLLFLFKNKVNFFKINVVYMKYMLYLWSIKQTNTHKMNYLHYLTDENGKQIETLYSNNNSSKISLEVMAKIKNASYQVWNKLTNEILTIEV